MRETILKESIKLFNEKGIDQTSMRDIAQKCGIAVGNLTYYFPKKDLLVTEIMKETMHDYSLKEEIQSIEEFRILIKRMIQSILDRRFYFMNSEFLKNMTSIVGVHDKNVHDLHEVLIQSLCNLEKNGCIHMTDSQRKDFVTFIMLSHITWCTTNEYNDHRNDTLDAFVEAHINILRAFEVN